MSNVMLAETSSQAVMADLTATQNNSHMTSTAESSGHVTAGDPVSDVAVQLVESIVSCGVVSVLAFFGCLANICNVLVFLSQGLRDNVNVSLFALTLADLVYVTLTLIRNAFCLLVAQGEEVLAENWRLLFIPQGVMLQFLFARVSSALTALISLERCVCVLLPLHTRYLVTHRCTVIAVVCIYIVVAATFVPVLMMYKVIWVPGTNDTASYAVMYPTDFYLSDAEFLGNFSDTINSILYPMSCLIIVAVCTLLTSLRLKLSSRWREGVTTATTTTTTTTIATTTTACYSPTSTSNMAADCDRSIIMSNVGKSTETGSLSVSSENGHPGCGGGDCTFVSQPRSGVLPNNQVQNGFSVHVGQPRKGFSADGQPQGGFSADGHPQSGFSVHGCQPMKGSSADDRPQSGFSNGEPQRGFSPNVDQPRKVVSPNFDQSTGEFSVHVDEAVSGCCSDAGHTRGGVSGDIDHRQNRLGSGREKGRSVRRGPSIIRSEMSLSQEEKGQNKDGPESSAQANNNRSSKMAATIKLTRLLVTIATIHIVCLMPSVVATTVRIFVPEFSLHRQYHNSFYVVYMIQFALDTLNASVNFVVYMTMSSRFLRTFRHLITCASRGLGRVKGNN